MTEVMDALAKVSVKKIMMDGNELPKRMERFNELKKQHPIDMKDYEDFDIFREKENEKKLIEQRMNEFVENKQPLQKEEVERYIE